MRRFWVVAPSGNMSHFSALTDRNDYLKDHPDYRLAKQVELEKQYYKECPYYTKKEKVK